MALDDIIKNSISTVSGLSGKTYPHDVLEDASPPFSFYLQEGGDEETALDGPTGLKSADYQIHVVAKTHAAMQLLGGAVQSALQALQGTVQGNTTIQAAECRQTQPDAYETNVGLFRKPLYLHLEYQNN